MKKFKIFAFIFFGILAGIASAFYSENIQNNIGIIRLKESNYLEVDNIYSLNTKLSKTENVGVNVYMPKYPKVEKEKADNYAKIFTIDENFKENDEYYSYSNETGVLYVYKFINKINYIKTKEYNSEKSIPKTIVSTNDALNICTEYIKTLPLIFNYDLATVNTFENAYEVVYVTKINNILNYGFNSKISLDKYGNVIAFTYYNMNYEKIGNLVILSEHDAYYTLPIDDYTNTKINIDKCQLIYVFADSVLQPYYLFSGINEKGKLFEECVLASNFGS